MIDANKIIKSLGYNVIDRQEKSISLWKEFYAGLVTSFHEYKEYQGAALGSVSRKRKSLKMAKSIAEIWADNLINPETVFVISGKEKQKWLDDYIKINKVKMKLNEFVEKVFALSNGATVQYKDANGKAINQYLTIESIYPLESFNGEIVSCAFVSIEADESLFIQIHQQVESGYVIYNKMFDKKGKAIELKEGIAEEIKSDVKLFQLYNPSIANNVNIGSPLGISIYANAIDELKSVDIAYDALDKEVRNGRMRVFVQGEALYNEKGESNPIFNKDQDEFFLLPEDVKNPDGTFITVQAPTLRIEDLIDNLNKQMNMLGAKCGLGDNSFYSDGGTIYTNTAQVVSTNSKFYKTREKHATDLQSSLIEMVQALYYLEHDSILTDECYIEFDDSIIHDKDEEWNRTMQLFNSGLISRVQVFQDLYGMTLEEAIKYNNNQIGAMDLPQEKDDEGGEV